MTERDIHDSMATDEFESESSGPEPANADTISAALLEAAESSSDFEHQRVFASVRLRLFGKGKQMHIGRFSVERRLGAGGMGEVYLCDDEALHRKVAVKLVLGIGSPREQARLRREAQAQAQLANANVVHVYEIGEHEGRTFVAMEYVDGQTLARWLREQPSKHDVLDRFLAAGRGLAAAHRAGIVHRDFKPENVLIGRDGVVRVADFGLALTPRGDVGPANGRQPANGDSAALVLALGARLNVTSSIAGTIRYMPLEQIRGEDVGPRSDQFAFCVALYEALWANPPFPIATPIERITALERGEPTRPPRFDRAGLWSVIRVGLHADPQQRWPDMDALLDALAGVGRRRQQWLGMVGAGMLAAVGVFGVFVARTPVELPVDPCAKIEHAFDDKWDRGALEQHFATFDAGHVEFSANAVLTGLDRWTESWLGESERLCQAYRAPEVAQQENECLERQRQTFELLANKLASADSATLAAALRAVDDLPAPSGCVGGLPGVDPPPAWIAVQVEAVRGEVARAHTLRLLGHREEARTVAKAANEAAIRLGYGPLKAEARGELAKAVDEAGQPLASAPIYDEAINLAEVHHTELFATQLLIERAELDLFHFEKPVEAGIRLGTANNRRLRWLREGGTDTWAPARFAFNHGRIAELGGDESAARASYLEALVIAWRDDPDSLDVPSYLDNLARVVGADHEVQVRIAAFKAAEHRFGPEHPRTGKQGLKVAQSLSGLAEAEAIDGNPAAALSHALVALYWFERFTKGPLDEDPLDGQALYWWSERSTKDPPDEGSLDEPVLIVHHLIANQLLSLGLLDQAMLEFEFVVAHATTPTQAMPSRLGLAEVLVRRGQLDEAEARLLIIDREQLGQHELTYELLRALVDLRQGRLDPAQIERFHAARNRSKISDDQLVAWLVELGLTARERRQLAP